MGSMNPYKLGNIFEHLLESHLTDHDIARALDNLPIDVLRTALEELARMHLVEKFSTQQDGSIRWRCTVPWPELVANQGKHGTDLEMRIEDFVKALIEQ
jgi:hypothetical protein